MALKSKKGIFARDDAQSAENTEEREPYIVFETKDDYDAAIADELKKRGGIDDAGEAPSEVKADAAAPQAQQREETEPQRLIEMWQRDAQNLKLIVPEFDLGMAVKNETFKNVLASGGNVFEAFAAASRPNGGAAGRDEIFQNAQSRSRGAGEAVVNPAKFSPEEFKKYIEQRRNS